jgi:hypothetical protein
VISQIAAAGVGITLMIVAMPGQSTSPGILASAATQKRVADLRTTDFRVVVTATKRGSGSAPTAKVAVVTFQRRDGSWVHTGSHVLRGSYFWHTVSGSRAICRFEFHTAAARTRERPRATVQLLMTPSLGCARAYEFVLTAR